IFSLIFARDDGIADTWRPLHTRRNRRPDLAIERTSPRKREARYRLTAQLGTGRWRARHQLALRARFEWGGTLGVRKTLGPESFDSETVHTMDYIEYAYLQTAQDRGAKEVVDELTSFRRSAAPGTFPVPRRKSPN